MLIEFKCVHVVKVKIGERKIYLASTGYKIEEEKLVVFAACRNKEFIYSKCWDSIQDCGLLYDDPGKLGWL